MFQYLLIDYYVSWGDKFVLCRYPDFVGFQSGCEAAEYAINWVCIKFSPLLFGNVDMASWAKNVECGNIGFSTMEYLVWCCMFECHCGGVIAYIVGVLMHLMPEAVRDAHVFEHCYRMLMGGVIISLGHSILLLGIWCLVQRFQGLFPLSWTSHGGWSPRTLFHHWTIWSWLCVQ